jgi:hypothetical protein
MLKGEMVTLQAVEKEDQESLWQFWNDLEVELAGGGDPPLPVSLERLRARFEREEREGTRDKTGARLRARSRGLLLDYAFWIRNFRRVWLEVHAANERAIRAYRACDFVEEGRMREHVWLAGRYVDKVIMGVMREEWQEGRTVGQGHS